MAITKDSSPEQILSDHPVYGHSELFPLADGVWYVTGTLGRSPLPRNMAIVRLDNGELLLHSVVAVNTEVLQQITQLGSVQHIIVPSTFHRFDALWYKAHFPKARFYCPEAIRLKVSDSLPIDSSCEEALSNLSLQMHKIPGIKPIELAYEIATESGAVLIFCDLLMNLPHLPGFRGYLLKLIGSTGFFGMTRLGKLFLMKDKILLKNWLLELADRDDIHSVLVSHGEPVRVQVRARLRDAAHRL